MSHILSFKEIKPAFIDIINDWYCLVGDIDFSNDRKSLFKTFEMYEEGILTEDYLINDYEWKVALFLLLSIIDTCKYLEDDININESDIPNVTKQDILIYVKSLCMNINALCYLYNNDDSFFGSGYGYEQLFSAEDFNRLASKDITNPTNIMSKKFFEKEMKDSKGDNDKEKIKVWLNDRRYFIGISKGERRLSIDELKIDRSDNISPFFYLEEYFNKISIIQDKNKEYRNIINVDDDIDVLLTNKDILMEISLLLDIDLISICSKVKSASDINSHRKKNNEKRNVIDINATVDYLKVINYILINGGEYYNGISETKRITPLVFGNSTLAIEKTKKVNVWINADNITDIEKYHFTIRYYEMTTPTKKPYGRNSNLKKIPELAYNSLFRLKICNGEDLIKLINYLNDKL
ncbi:hypothetical protein [Photobacterium leiognathi]|uniref:hypothetical protein n=1 Tax=Photobacterium leiognathi TaxID=553611 RepID=UPI002980EC88|nr:hypothetical protein [Photobacterium leiognathi]